MDRDWRLCWSISALGARSFDAETDEIRAHRRSGYQKF